MTASTGSGGTARWPRKCMCNIHGAIKSAVGSVFTAETQTGSQWVSALRKPFAAV